MLCKWMNFHNWRSLHAPHHRQDPMGTSYFVVYKYHHSEGCKLCICYSPPEFARYQPQTVDMEDIYHRCLHDLPEWSLSPVRMWKKERKGNGKSVLYFHFTMFFCLMSLLKLKDSEVFCTIYSNCQAQSPNHVSQKSKVLRPTDLDFGWQHHP